MNEEIKIMCIRKEYKLEEMLIDNKLSNMIESQEHILAKLEKISKKASEKANIMKEISEQLIELMKELGIKPRTGLLVQFERDRDMELLNNKCYVDKTRDLLFEIMDYEYEKGKGE